MPVSHPCHRYCKIEKWLCQSFDTAIYIVQVDAGALLVVVAVAEYLAGASRQI